MRAKQETSIKKNFYNKIDKFEKGTLSTYGFVDENSLPNKSDKLSGSIGLPKEEDKLNPGKTFKTNIICNHSIHLREAFFTNYLNDTQNTDNDICRVLKMNGKIFSEEFLQENGVIHSGKKNNLDRINKILSQYTSQVFDEEDLDILKKYYLKNIITRSTVKEEGNLLRIITIPDEDFTEVKILLIDSNHLFATEKFEDDYQKHKSNTIDIKDKQEKIKNLYK